MPNFFKNYFTLVNASFASNVIPFFILLVRLLVFFTDEEAASFGY